MISWPRFVQPCRRMPDKICGKRSPGAGASSSLSTITMPCFRSTIGSVTRSSLGFRKTPSSSPPADKCRQMPPEPWQTDPAWKALIHTRALDNLSADESADYLTLRGVPAAEHDEI